MPRIPLRFLIVFLFAALFLPASLALAETNIQETPGNISEDEYWTLVEETLAEVNTLQASQPVEEIQQALAPYILRWNAITAITLEHGEIIPASGSHIASILRNNDPQAASTALTALLDARDNYPPSGHTASDLESLAPILARSEFQWPEEQPNPIQKFINDLLQRFWDWVANLLPENGINLDLSSVRFLFDALAGILFALVLFFILRYVYTGFITETATQAGDEDETEILNAQTAMSRAQTFSGAGDYRTAVRYLYLSALLLLDERGLLRYDRAKTNREYLRSLSAYPELAAPLGAVIDVFDRVWYGFEALDEQTYEQYRAHVESLKEQK